MGVISGLGATINGYSCVEKFTIVGEGLDNAVACSSSDGKVVRALTNKDWKGECHGYGGTPPVMPGALLSFKGGGVGGNGICDRAVVTCDPQRAEIIQWSIWVSAASGVPAANSAFETATAVALNPGSSKGMGVGGGGGSWKLDIRCHNTPPVWLSADLGWPNRSRGYVDAIAEWEQFLDPNTNMPTEGDAATVILPVTVSTSWTVPGICLEHAIEVIVHDRQNRPQYVKSIGKIGFSGAASASITTPSGAAYPAPL